MKALSPGNRNVFQDRRGRFGRDVMSDVHDPGYITGNLPHGGCEQIEREPRRGRGTGVQAVPAAHFDPEAEVALSVAHPGHPVLVKYRHILKRLNPREQPFHDGSGFPDRLDALRIRLVDHPGRERRPGKRDALEDLLGQARTNQPRLEAVALACPAKLVERRFGRARWGRTQEPRSLCNCAC
jgi:hypothetical protein